MVASRSFTVEEAEVGDSPEAAVEEDTKVREDMFMPTDDEAGDVAYGDIKRDEIHMIDHNYSVSSGKLYIRVGHTLENKPTSLNPFGWSLLLCKI